MALNIVLNLILIKYIGHAGLALATSISALVCIVLLFRSLRKKIGNFGEEKKNSRCVYKDFNIRSSYGNCNYNLL